MCERCLEAFVLLLEMEDVCLQRMHATEHLLVFLNLFAHSHNFGITALKNNDDAVVLGRELLELFLLSEVSLDLSLILEHHELEVILLGLAVDKE